MLSQGHDLGPLRGDHGVVFFRLVIASRTSAAFDWTRESDVVRLAAQGPRNGSWPGYLQIHHPLLRAHTYRSSPPVASLVVEYYTHKRKENEACMAEPYTLPNL